MNVTRPLWELKASRCRYCEQGELIFSTCSSCLSVVLICAECGTVYEITNKNPGKEIGDTSGATKCQGCGVVSHHVFPPSTDQEIVSLGFTPNEYQ